MSLVCLAVSLLLSALTGTASGFSASTAAYDTIARCPYLLDPVTGRATAPGSIFDADQKKTLVVFLPQLGEFDSSEYCEFLVAAQGALVENDIALRVIGIGNTRAAEKFCQFTSLSPAALRIDPDAGLYKELGLYAGPDLAIPDSVSDGVLKFFLRQLPGGVPDDPARLRPVAKAWLDYNAMCAGIGAPGTLREILRGYFGDKRAPERFRDNAVVQAGFVTIGPGVGPTKIGPLEYIQWFADERGYQRPVELATVRLKNMVEVLTQWDDYVSNPLTIPQRGGTFLFDDGGRELYAYRSRGILTFSQTMPRPLSFLAPYIGARVANNPLELRDDGGGEWTSGRGWLKPLGKALGFLSGAFALETQLQARLLGADEVAMNAAADVVAATIARHRVVVYTYGWSPFSAEALRVLDEVGAEYKTVELGPEWFWLGREPSAVRAALLNKFGQSSLPHIFVDGQHLGGLFTGTSDGSSPGLAGLRESGRLRELVSAKDIVEEQQQ